MSATFAPQALANKWDASTLKGSTACQEHFNGLCRMPGRTTPAELDPTGACFTFQKGLVKNLFALRR
jgi:hypothetical protein